MNELKNKVPAITINGKEYCINVGRDVIRVLDHPSHICILEHDNWKMIAIAPSDGSALLSFPVPEGFPEDRRKKFRIYSQSLVNEIITECDLDPGATHNLKGEYVEAMNAVLFSAEGEGDRVNG